MTSAALEALAARCEQATGPDRELDRAIHKEVKKRLVSDETFIFAEGSSRNTRRLTFEYPLFWELWLCPRYTSSFDDAETLVPARHQMAMGDTNHDDVAWACLTDRAGNDYSATAVDPINALCAAASKARAALAKSGAAS